MNQIQFYKMINQYAMQAKIYEVLAWTGMKHKDNDKKFDIYSAMNSIAGFSTYFYDCAVETIKLCPNLLEEKNIYNEMFKKVQQIGIQIKEDTGGKIDEIFSYKSFLSLGIIAAAASIVYWKTGNNHMNIQDIVYEIRKLTEGVCENKSLHKEADSSFLGLGKNYEEIKLGYPTVCNVSCPILTNLLEKDEYRMDDILQQVFLNLIAHTKNTAILEEDREKTLELFQEQAKKVLEAGGIFTVEGKKLFEELKKNRIDLNRNFIEAADLLAVTIMFCLLQRGKV